MCSSARGIRILAPQALFPLLCHRQLCSSVRGMRYSRGAGSWVRRLRFRLFGCWFPGLCFHLSGTDRLGRLGAACGVLFLHLLFPSFCPNLTHPGRVRKFGNKSCSRRICHVASERWGAVVWYCRAVALFLVGMHVVHHPQCSTPSRVRVRPGFIFCPAATVLAERASYKLRTPHGRSRGIGPARAERASDKMRRGRGCGRGRARGARV